MTITVLFAVSSIACWLACLLTCLFLVHARPVFFIVTAMQTYLPCALQDPADPRTYTDDGTCSGMGSLIAARSAAATSMNPCCALDFARAQACYRPRPIVVGGQEASRRRRECLRTTQRRAGTRQSPVGCAGDPTATASVGSTVYDIDQLIQAEINLVRQQVGCDKVELKLNRNRNHIHIGGACTTQGGNGAAADLTERGMATRPVRPEKPALVVPGDLVVTRIDAEKCLGKDQLQDVDDLTGMFMLVMWFGLVWSEAEGVCNRDRLPLLTPVLSYLHTRSQHWRCGFCMKERLGPLPSLLCSRACGCGRTYVP